MATRASAHVRDGRESTWRIETMQPEDKFACVGDYNLHYRQSGTGPETVVLLHGIPTNAFLWHAVTPYLDELYTVVVPDMLGYGFSDRAPHEELGLTCQAKHILRLLDTINVQQAHFVGHDLGGGVAQIVAVKHPERVLSLVVADSVCFANWPLPKVSAIRWPTAPEFEPGIPLIRQMLRGGIYNPEVLTPRVMDAFTAPFDTPSGAEDLRRCSLGLDHYQTEDIVPELPNLSMPVTLLWGQHDPYTTPYWGHQLEEHIPNAKLTVLPDCGHYSMLDNPDLFAQELLRHLEDATSQLLQVSSSAQRRGSQPFDHQR
jgi:2-hydroxymuconate-semialdehyde hydrolase